MMEWSETATVIDGDRGFVFIVTPVGSKFNAAVAEGPITDTDDFVEESLTMIGTNYRTAAGARRACAAYLRRVRRVVTCAITEDPDVLAQLALAEAVSPIMREAGTIPQA